MTPTLRILSWNVRHATREIPLPAAFYAAVAQLAPEVLILNEFKDGPSRLAMRSELAKQGLPHCLVSQDRKGFNQVLIASSTPVREGDLQCAANPDGHATTNFLHVALPSKNLEIVGFRAPAYSSKAERSVYWQELVGIMKQASERDIIFAGDFNSDPAVRGSDAHRYLPDLRSEGWQVSEPTGGWSFASGTRIDHAAAAPKLELRRCEYVQNAGGIVLADSQKGNRVSDHAALLLEVGWADRPRTATRTGFAPLSDAPNGSTCEFAPCGSQRWLQVAAELAPDMLQRALAQTGAIESGEWIEWRSPRAANGFQEYRDTAMLQLLGIRELPRRHLSSFWPPGGPIWDGLGLSDKGRVILIEAKAHIAEAASTPCRASEAALDHIRRSLEEARSYLAPRSNADWSCTFYQYANRLAFLYFLSVLNGVNTRMVFLHFCKAPDVRSPESPDEWKGATELIHTLLGLPSDLSRHGVYHAYIQVPELAAAARMRLGDGKHVSTTLARHAGE